MDNVHKAKWSFKGPVWESVSEEAKDFVKRLMTLNPDDRPSAEEIL